MASMDAAVERRLSQRRPAEILIERIERARPRSAAPLQLISSSATISSDLRRQIGALLGGKGKKDAGTVVSSEPAHPSPKALKRFGVGGVQLPSTIRHSAYVGRESALNQMLKLVFEEYGPTAPLLVLPNGQSVARRVQSLRAIGMSGAVALNDALCVPKTPSAAAEPEPAAADGLASEDGDGGGEGGGDGGAEPRSRRVRAKDGESLQDAMVRSRTKLAASFAVPRGEREKLGVPLLVTTEFSARGIDFKGIDCVILVGLPERLDSYIHVAGRTAREGRKGRAVCLLTRDGEAERLQDFGRELGIQIESVDVRFLKGRE